MSIRIALCFLFVLGFSIYAWRNWFVSLCALVLLMAVVQHPDMPTSIGGIQGLNPWNFLMLNVLLAWNRWRRREGLTWDLPGHIVFLLLLYLLAISSSFLRFVINPENVKWYSFSYSISEHFINCVKWVLPGLLLFDGCRSRGRVVLAIGCILTLYLLLALQVIKNVPPGAALESELSKYAAKTIQHNVGYNRVTLSMMLGGASWAILSTLILLPNRWQKLGLITAAGIVSFGQALTGGRTGYVAWGLVGLILCLVRWRRLLPVIPSVVILVMVFLPGVRERMTQGFGDADGQIRVQRSDYEITSGRSIAWPYVVKSIYRSPIFGYGRLAMKTTGISRQIDDDFGQEDFPHPHNAYLEILLDCGIIGFLCVIPFYLVALTIAFKLLLDRNEELSCAVGGIACALILALLFGAMGGQTFYPREGAVGLWAAMFLALRVWVERQSSLATGLPLFTAYEPQSDSEPREVCTEAT